MSASAPPQLSPRLRADERCSRDKGDDLSHRGKRDLALFCGCLSKEEGKIEGNRDGPESVIRMDGYLLFCQHEGSSLLTHHEAEGLKHVLITCSDRRRQSALGILQRLFPPNHTSSTAPHHHPILGLALPIILPLLYLCRTYRQHARANLLQLRRIHRCLPFVRHASFGDDVLQSYGDI